MFNTLSLRNLDQSKKQEIDLSPLFEFVRRRKCNIEDKFGWLIQGEIYDPPPPSSSSIEENLTSPDGSVQGVKGNHPPPSIENSTSKTNSDGSIQGENGDPPPPSKKNPRR